MSTVYSCEVLDPHCGISGDRLGAKGFRGDRLGLARTRRLPGGHHAGVAAGGGVEVLELVRSRRQVDLALDPRIVNRPVPAGGGHDDLAVDQQEAAILARREEAVGPASGDPQRAVVHR